MYMVILQFLYIIIVRYTVKVYRLYRVESFENIDTCVG